MKKAEKLKKTTDNRRVYHILNTWYHWLDNECGFNGKCGICNYRKTGVCRSERTEIRNWKHNRKTQWKQKIK